MQILFEYSDGVGFGGVINLLVVSSGLRETILHQVLARYLTEVQWLTGERLGFDLLLRTCKQLLIIKAVRSRMAY